MDAENEQQDGITEVLKVNNAYLQKFRLYETRSNFYMVGRSKNRSACRVLKIDRREPTELNITEDPTTYTESECSDLLKRIHDGNKSTGGLRFVYTCYGIVGFIKLLGPYYMLLIAEREKIGVICGHAIYAISKSEVLPIPNSTVRPSVAYSKNENRSLSILRANVKCTFGTFKGMLCEAFRSPNYIYAYVSSYIKIVNDRFMTYLVHAFLNLV